MRGSLVAIQLIGVAFMAIGAVWMLVSGVTDAARTPIACITGAGALFGWLAHIAFADLLRWLNEQ